MMRDTRDAASSVVIGFVILLMLVALGIGIWALISLPAQMQEAESTHAIVLQNAFLDFKLSADKVRVNDLSGARFSMLLPGRAGISGSTVSFVKTDGKLHIYNVTGESVETDLVMPWWENIGRLSASVGGSRGTTVIGYEGGGVFRSDNGNAVWLTPGLIQIYPDESTNNTINVEIVMPLLSGETATSSNWGVPLDCRYLERNDSKSFFKEDINMLISFTSNDEMQKNLWYSMFSEAMIRYISELKAWKERHPGAVTMLTDADVTVNHDDSRITLTINVLGNKGVKVYIREATYDVSLFSGAAS